MTDIEELQSNVGALNRSIERFDARILRLYQLFEQLDHKLTELRDQVRI